MKNKKMEKEIVALVLTIIFCVIAVATVLLILINTFDEKQKEVEIEENKPPVVYNYNASIFFGGKVDASDDLIAEYTINGKEDYYGLLENIEPAITNNDIALFQLDDVVVDTYTENGVPKGFADQFTNIGFSMVSLASQGQLELGENALQTSHTYWNEQSLYTAGSKVSGDTTTEIYEKNGITFGLLGYTMPDNVKEYTITNPGILDVYSDELVTTEIQSLRNQVDVIIVYLDWNDIDSFEVSNEQHRIAKLLADSGADIILGTNTGSIQPVEWIGSTIIYYSLGNLVTDDTDLDDRIGMIGSIYIQKTVIDGKTTIEKSQPKADLVYMSNHPSKVMMLEEVADLENKNELYEEYSSVIKMLDDSIRLGGIK